jgi:GTP-binding protein LepA
MIDNIRNFVIIAHVDHGKSTLADRFLEITGTVEARKMKPQYLDMLELERERGITIKMAPVRMVYNVRNVGDDGNVRNEQFEQAKRSSNSSKSYILNLIDTPGHGDFSYEVSRALAAVEGAVLLVDATKGIQAQTLSNFRAAKAANLKIIGAVSKIDLAPVHLENVINSLADLLGVMPSEIFRVSGKTGDGVRELIAAIIKDIPQPYEDKLGRALIFDSLYDDHRGILAFLRMFGGEIRAGDEVTLLASKSKLKVKEVGIFSPELAPIDSIKSGGTGYMATGLKEPDLVKIGDTVSVTNSNIKPLAGYREPHPVVFISFYPDRDTKFDDLKRALSRLRLTDAALSFEPDANEALGRGLKVGFLGQLHFEITSSRLEREFNLDFITSFPSIAYRVISGGKEMIVKDAHEFPEDPEKVFEPMIRIEIIAPAQHLGDIINLKNVFEINISEVANMGESVIVKGNMPLAELIRDFDDQLKSVSAGYASFSYELSDEEPAEVEKLEILIAGETASALTRIVRKKDIEREARVTVTRLKDLLPKEQFVQAIQAKTRGRIIARETISAMRKDVTGYLYGGDRSRKMKLWKKQKRGKEKLKEMGKVNLSVEVFREILKK